MARARKPVWIERFRVNRRQSSLSRNMPVTPEVAGSSPVAPVKYLQIASFVVDLGANDRRLHFIPRRSRTRIAAPSWPEPVIPATRGAGRRDRRSSSCVKCDNGPVTREVHAGAGRS
jgi:hypothetical protein